MTDSVDFESELEQLHTIAKEHGHTMVRPESMDFTGESKKTEVDGTYCRDMWMCEHEGCEAIIVVICSDGTVEALGFKGTIYSLFSTEEASYKCGVKLDAIMDPAHYHSGTPKIH